MTLPDGRTLGWAQYGAIDGKPLLYFHGGVSSRLDIEFANSHCQENNIRLIAPDRPGIGISSPQPKRSLLDWTSDVEHLLNHLNIESLPLLGWSLAGPYVWACAYKLPQRFTKISTVGGASPILPPVKVEQLGLLADRMLLSCPPALESVLAASLDASGKLPAQTMKWILENELSDNDKAIVQELSLAEATDFIFESTRQGGMGVVDDYRAVAQDWGFDLGEIRGDVTLWHGDEDRLLPILMTQYLKDHIPHVTVNIVPKRGHFLLHRMLDEVLSPLFS
ncbi:alpha/beta hydrolase [bacterium]|nr:alpha/beta hydrolase [bacterium]